MTYLGHPRGLERMAPADQERAMGVVLALAESAYLRRVVGAPLAMRDLAEAVGRARSLWTTGEDPPLPQPLAGDGRPPEPSYWGTMREQGAAGKIEPWEDGDP